MTVTATFASLTVLFAVLLAIGFFLLRPPKCPRCGSREWVPNGHLGPFVVYCRGCTWTRDLADPP